MIRRYSWPCVAVAVLLCAAPIAAQPRAPHRQELTAALARVLDAEDFRQPQTLKEFLKRLQDRAGVQGRELPLLVDAEAFKDKLPEGADLYDTPVKLPPYPRQMTAAALLRHALANVPSGDATYYVKNGVVVVTTEDRTWARRLMGEVVEGKFQAQPLGEVLQELAAQTGLHLMVDSRIAWRLQAKASVNFTVNETSLGTALFLLTDMVDLRVALVGNVAYVTSPANAWQFLNRLASGFPVTPLGSREKPAME
jgi:hypothetical protein